MLAENGIALLNCSCIFTILYKWCEQHQKRRGNLTKNILKIKNVANGQIFYEFDIITMLVIIKCSELWII